VRRRRGFTLLETAIVLAITAVGALLVLPTWPSALAPDAPRDASPGAELAAALADARRHAIAARQLVMVRVDVSHQRVRVDTAGTHGRGVWRDGPLPLSADESLVTADTVALYVFRPTGAAQGRPMSIRHASGWTIVAIDPWSGEVRRVAR